MEDDKIFIGLNGEGDMQITIPPQLTVNVRADCIEINPKDTTISLKKDFEFGDSLDSIVDEIIKEEREKEQE